MTLTAVELPIQNKITHFKYKAFLMKKRLLPFMTNHTTKTIHNILPKTSVGDLNTNVKRMWR